MRLSLNQKDALFVLLLIERSQGETVTPTLAVNILKIINQTRDTPIHASNLRVSLHTLTSNKLVEAFRTPSLKLAFKLTPLGREQATSIYKKREEK